MSKSKLIKGKKGLFGLVVKLVVAAFVLYLIYAAFLKPEIYANTWDSVKNTISGSMPERDPYPWETNINAQRAQAVEVLQEMVRNFNKTAENRASYVPEEVPINETKGNCFGGFSTMPESFFENKFSIRIRNESYGMSIQLFELRTDTFDEGGNQKSTTTRIPASSKYEISGYSPCVIYDVSAQLLLEKAVVNSDMESIIDKFGFQQNVEGINLYEKDKITFFLKPDGSQEYTLDFKPGEDRYTYLIFKILDDHGNSLCLMPTSDDSDCTIKDKAITEGCLDKTSSDPNLYTELTGNLKGAICRGYSTADLT